MVEFPFCVACKVVLASFKWGAEESFFKTCMEETGTVMLMKEFNAVGSI